MAKATEQVTPTVQVQEPQLPDPSQGYAPFIYKLMQLPRISNVTQYNTLGGKKAKLWTMYLAEHIQEGLEDGLLDIGMITAANGDRHNSYEPTPAARAFWANGIEDNTPPEKILEGWRAMQTIMNEDAKKGD